MTVARDRRRAQRHGRRAWSRKGPLDPPRGLRFHGFSAPIDTLRPLDERSAAWLAEVTIVLDARA